MKTLKLRTYSDDQIQNVLEGLTKFKVYSEGIRDYLQKLGEWFEAPQLPFSWSQLRVINIRPSVVPSLLQPKPRLELIQALDEVVGMPTLVMDGIAAGKDALWLVMCGKPDLNRWYDLMTIPSLVVGSYQGAETYVGAPLKAFCA